MNAVPSSPAVSRRSLWFGSLGGAFAWLVHLLASWSISEFGCFAGLHRTTLLGLTIVAWALIALSAAMLSASLAATWVAYRSDCRIRRHGFRTNTADETAGFLARAGLVASGLFALIIAAQTIPIFFYLRSC
jgi:hypothetical protein